MNGIKKISASAGSGKTWRLTEEYIAALTHAPSEWQDKNRACKFIKNMGGASASEILAITFTNAAATEMRAKVLEKLKKAALKLEGGANQAPEIAMAWVNNSLRDISSLNIRTIDSLLNMLVRASALELGLNPDYEISFKTEEVFEPYAKKFLDQLINNPEDHKLLKEALEITLNYGTDAGFLIHSNFLANLYDIIEKIMLGEFVNCATVEQLEDLLATQKNNMQQIAAELLEGPDCKILELNSNAKNFLEACRAGTGKTSAYDHKPKYRDLFNGSTGSTTQEGEELYKKLKNHRTYPDAKKAIPDSIKLLSLFKIAQRVKDEWIADAPDIIPDFLVARLALKSLTGENGVNNALCRLGTRLSHFLIDEFQDTSHEQWEVLRQMIMEAGSHGGSLTFVGDVKQAIYNFRGADSKLFGDIYRDPELTAIMPRQEPVSLKFNWRSKPAVIEHNNKFFKTLKENAEKVFQICVPAEMSEPDSEFSETYQDLLNTLKESYADVEQECAYNGQDTGFVKSIMVKSSNETEYNRQVLPKVCEIIEECIDNGRSCKDILILCRINAQCKNVATFLLENHIPVITDNSLLLADHHLIIQLIAFLRFLQNPDDNISFWILVSGSIFFNLPNAPTQKELTGWLANLKKDDYNILYKKFITAFPDAWNLYLSPFYSQSGLLTAYDMIKEWYNRANIEKRFPDDTAFLRRFIEVIAAAEDKDAQTVAAFLDYWDNAGMNEYAPLPETMDAVRVMTIHGAKGLQAPVVIVPWTDFAIKESATPQIVEKDNLRIPAKLDNKFWGKPYFESMGRQSIEVINLLYVAFTRAEDELYYFYKIAPTKEKKKTKASKSEDPLKPGKKNLAACIPFLIKEAGFEPEYELGKKCKRDARSTKDLHNVTATTDPHDLGGGMGQDVEMQNIDSDWMPMKWLPRLKIFRAKPASQTLTPEERGTFVHFCLEKLTLKESPAEDAQLAFEYGLRESQIHIPDDPEIRKGLIHAIQSFASLFDAKYWLRNGIPEQSLIDADGNELRSDLIVRHGEDILVIDYKTGQKDSSHIRQMQNYMKCIKDSGQYSGIITGLLIYLDCRNTGNFLPDMQAVNLEF